MLRLVFAASLAVSLGTGAAFAAAAPGAPASPAAAATPAQEPPWRHAYARFGDPKYPPGFEHFDYADPNAVKGGTLYLANPDRRTSYDKFNPFTLKGDAPAGVSEFMFESLMDTSADEPESIYGLVAEQIQVAPDFSYVGFRINPLARFNNGDPVTPADVKFSFEMMSGPGAGPSYQSQFGGIERAEIVDDRTVRFYLKEKTADEVFIAAGLPVFSHKWGMKPDGTNKKFDEIITEYPIATGPYTIALDASGRRIEFVRDPNYWARDLGVRKGFYNFDRVVYRYYLDDSVKLEAFKAGEYDIIEEYSARRWIHQHTGAKYRDGEIVKHAFPTDLIEGYAGFYLNNRRKLFQDERVREALNYSYDFDQMDRLSSHQYKRIGSVFSNSEYAATGMPTPGELKMLEPFRAQLDPVVFGPAWVNPVNGPHSEGLRANLLKARDLLAAAGWKIAPDGVLRNAAGEAFEFEYLDPEGSAASAMSSWLRNLEKLGITMHIRQVDYALYARRIDALDFDMVEINPQTRTLPSASALVEDFGSKAADVPGSNNYIGVKNPVLDALADTMGRATTMDELRDTARAYDRVFMHQNYAVPYLYTSDIRMSYWNKFGIPATVPRYYTALLVPDESNLLAWPLATWWIKTPTAVAGAGN